MGEAVWMRESVYLHVSGWGGEWEHVYVCELWERGCVTESCVCDCGSAVCLCECVCVSAFV